MPRFFAEQVEGDKALLAGDDVRHIKQVLRMREGDALTLCDGKGTDYQGVISQIGEREILCTVGPGEKSKSEPVTWFHLYQCVPKGDKFEFIIQKAVELGVSEITPVLSRRCVSRPDQKTAVKKGERYQKIALSAAKQSGRGMVPRVNPQISFDEAVCQVKGSPCAILFYEKGGVPLSQAVRPQGACPGQIDLLIGSEGGFDAEEAKKAAEAGVQLATLGPRILRCETAPLCALSVLLYLTGNLE